jgi:hypothetical protein
MAKATGFRLNFKRPELVQLMASHHLADRLKGVNQLTRV